jgi:hypothetical protein
VGTIGPRHSGPSPVFRRGETLTGWTSPPFQEGVGDAHPSDGELSPAARICLRAFTHGCPVAAATGWCALPDVRTGRMRRRGRGLLARRPAGIPLQEHARERRRAPWVGRHRHPRLPRRRSTARRVRAGPTSRPADSRRSTYTALCADATPSGRKTATTPHARFRTPPPVNRLHAPRPSAGWDERPHTRATGSLG